MDTNLVFALEVGLSASLSLACILYVQPALKAVIGSLCHDATSQFFWGRITAALMFLMPLLLVLAMSAGEDATALQHIRQALIMTIAGLCSVLAMIARTIRRNTLLQQGLIP